MEEDLEIYKDDPENRCKIGEKIWELFNEDLKFSTQTMSLDIDRAPKVFNRWMKERYDAVRYLENLKIKRYEIESELELRIKTEDDPRLSQLVNNSRKLKEEVKKQPTYKKICKKIADQERVIAYLEEIIVCCRYHINDRIKNKLKLMELEKR